MRDLFLRLCRWGLTILGVNAVISCNDNVDVAPLYGVIAAEYGSPFIEFKLKGKVVSSHNETPVKGIAVTYTNEKTNIESKDTVWTAADGGFEYNGADFPTESVILKFTDVDGISNVDEFRTKEVQVKLSKEQDGEGNWNMGVYTADDLLIKLEPDVEIAVEYGVQYSEYSKKPKAK